MGDRRARIRPNFELRGNLTAFQVEETATEAGIVRVGLNEDLIQRPRRNVVSSFGAEATAEVQVKVLDSIVSGFNEALQDVMEQLVEWTLRTGIGA